MSRDRYVDEDDLNSEEEDYEEANDEVEEDEEYRGSGKARRKRTRSDLVDDLAEQDDEEEEEDDYEEYGGGRHSRKQQKNPWLSNLIDDEAQVDSDEEEDEVEPEDDGFIDIGPDIRDDDGDRRIHHRPLLPPEDEPDIEDLERRIEERYQKTHDQEYYEEATEVGQQALLPSVREPELSLVKCAIGREREAAACLMQKSIDRGHEMQIRSAMALDIEADKEDRVKSLTHDCIVVEGMRYIYLIMFIPIKEMTGAVSVGSKAIDVSRDTWACLTIFVLFGRSVMFLIYAVLFVTT